MMEVSEVINIQHFLQEWTDVLNSQDYQHHGGIGFHDYITNEMPISKEMVDELASVCGTTTLACEGEEQTNLNDLLKSVPPDVDLVTTGLQMQELEKRQKCPKYKRRIRDGMKYKFEDGPWLHQIDRKEPEPEMAIKLPEVLLNVKVYKTFHGKTKPLVNEEYHLLGSQLLTELRDQIHCVSDKMVLGDFSDNPNMPQDVKSKDLYKSGFFYLEGVFYNDTRDPTCRDYSKVVMDWAKEPSRHIGPFTSEKMEETRFNELVIRLGQPYVYLHQGNCEHLLIFTDMRLVHPEDKQGIGDYPLLTVKSRERRVMCRLCQMHTAKWITHNSSLSPEDPCFFCDTCFRIFHYDSEGKKVCDFQAHPYNCS